jgi:amphi-Trp domain-containing protein
VEDIKKLEFEAMASPAEIAGVLSRLADGFRSKILHVSWGAEDVTVHPLSDISLQIEAHEHKGKTQLEIALAWRPLGSAHAGD